MSKSLVQKALLLLQNDVEIENSKREKCKDSSLKVNKKKNQMKVPVKHQSHKKNKPFSKTYSDILQNYKSVDKTEENLHILEQLRCLKPKKAVAEKVIQFYSKQKKEILEETLEKTEPRSILFDDSPKKNKRKKI